MTSDVETVDPLRLERCPSCGYQLEGLPDEGTCPECGRQYNQSVVVLHGWGRGTHASVLTAPPWLAVSLWVLQSVYFVNVLFNPPMWRSPWVLPVLAVWVLSLIFSVWRRRNNTLPGLVQVLLGPSGCAQLDDPARNRHIPPTPWAEIAEVDLRNLGDGKFRVRAFTKQSSWWRPVRTPVDADVQLTPSRGRALGQRVAEWRAASKAGVIPAAADV